MEVEKKPTKGTSDWAEGEMYNHCIFSSTKHPRNHDKSKTHASDTAAWSNQMDKALIIKATEGGSRRQKGRSGWFPHAGSWWIRASAASGRNAEEESQSWKPLKKLVQSIICLWGRPWLNNFFFLFFSTTHLMLNSHCPRTLSDITGSLLLATCSR